MSDTTTARASARVELAPGTDLSRLSDPELFEVEDHALAGARAGRRGAEQAWREIRAEQYARATERATR